MSAIGKTFTFHGEKFIVMIEGCNHYINDTSVSSVKP